MVSFYHAYTAPINPAGATPVLTSAQVWQGLQRKIRFAQEFVPAIVDCKVINETDKPYLHGTTVVEVERKVRFKDRLTGEEDEDGWLREVVRSYEPTWVDFIRDDGTVVRNLISNGPEEGDQGLQLTYIFEFHHPEVTPGSAEANGLLTRDKNVSKMAVEESIKSIRRMVVEGKIK